MVTPLSSPRRLPRLSQRVRRLAVVGAFTGYPLLQLGYWALVAPGQLSSTIWAPIAIALFSITIVSVFALYGYGRGRMGYPKHQLDERQRTMHDRALVVSYGVVTTAVGLVLGGLAGWAMNEPVVIDMASLVPVLIGAGLYLPVLPFAALAWIEPDLPADDEA
jgi:hypothetical protein